MDVMVPGQETEQEEMTGHTCHQPVSSPLPGSHVGLSVPFGGEPLQFAKKPHKVKSVHLVKGKEVSNPPLKPGSVSGSPGDPLEEGFHSGPPEQRPLTVPFLCALFLSSQGLRLEDWPWGDKLVLHDGFMQGLVWDLGEFPCGKPARPVPCMRTATTGLGARLYNKLPTPPH